MSAEQENISKILSVLSHRIRREILLILREKDETSFTDLMNTLKIDTGKLSFHMRSLQPFIQQTASGKYRLSRAGEDAVRVIKDVESWAELSSVKQEASALALASFTLRASGFLIDFCIMVALSFLVLLEFFVSFGGVNLLAVLVNLLVVASAFLWIYSTVLEGFRGQTIGKRAIGIMAVKADGRKIDYEHAAVRNFGKVLLPFDLLFGYTLKDPRYIRYFDKFAGTTVIDLRRHQTRVKASEPERVEPQAPP